MSRVRRTRINWAGIKQDYLEGKSLAEMAKRWRLAKHVIARTAKEEGWITDTIAEEVALNGGAIVPGPNGPQIQGVLGSVVQGPMGTGVQMATEAELPVAGRTSHVELRGTKFHEDPAAYQKFIATYMQEQMADAVQLRKLKAPATWKDWATADAMMRRALGLDSKGGGVAVAVSIGGGTSGKMGPVDVTVDAVEASEEGE